jgi:hypothetical protein
LYVEGPDSRWHLFDLPSKAELAGPSFKPEFSEDMSWMIGSAHPKELRWYEVISTSRTGGNIPWVDFFNYDGSAYRYALFRDGRYLAWSDENGAITVADLRDVQNIIDEFERTYLPK